jgi:AcrR family transcriptional regulator
MPRTAEQFKNIRKKRQQLIMDAALKVISERGYHGTSIAAIAKESGVSKGLMYNYFSSKEELLVEIMKEGYSRVFEKFVINENLTPEENVMKLITVTFDVMEEMKETIRIYFSIMMETEVFNLVKELLNELSEPFMEDFAKLMAGLGFENPMAEAFFLRFILDGISINYLMFPEEFPKEYCLNRFKQIYLINK